jgi:hypothetical protein
MGKFLSEGAVSQRTEVSRIAQLTVLCLAPLLTAFLCAPCFSRAHETGAASFSIDLDKPFAEVEAVVSDVAHTASIKGTFEYRGEDELTGAQFAETSRLFPPWTGPGKVFYKIRTKALSPTHFLNSNDVGTVAVRYIVQERGPNSTRLFIDAIFVENAHHHDHPSDGYVETCEFGDIGKRLKERDELIAEGQPGAHSQESSSRSEPRKATAPSAPVAKTEAPRVEIVDSAKTADLQRAINEQKSLLAADYDGLAKLQKQAGQIRSAEFVRVKADRAELKASPYAHARVVEALKKGQEVTVLGKSAYWYQVRAEDGEEGWISHSFLEVHP